MPAKLVESLLEAAANYEAARRDRDKAIVAALKAGASLSSVAEVTGMSPSGVRKIGKANGWNLDAWHEERRQLTRERAERWSLEDGVDPDEVWRMTDPKKPKK